MGGPRWHRVADHPQVAQRGGGPHGASAVEGGGTGGREERKPPVAALAAGLLRAPFPIEPQEAALPGPQVLVRGWGSHQHHHGAPEGCFLIAKATQAPWTAKLALSPDRRDRGKP